MISDVNFPVFIKKARIAAVCSATDPERALDAILYSAIAVEAFPNDVARHFEMPFKYHPDKLTPELLALHRIMPELEESRARVQTKYQILYFVLSGKTFDPQTPLFQEFEFLVKLRNQLLHPKCGSFEQTEDDKSYDKLSRSLIKAIRNRGLSGWRQKTSVPWKWHLKNQTTADWAVSVAKNMVCAIIDVVPRHQSCNWFHGLRGPHTSMEGDL